MGELNLFKSFQRILLRLRMSFYHVRIRYAPNRLTKLFFGKEGSLFQEFYNLSEEDIRGIRESQKKDVEFELCGNRIVPNRILAINVYRTEKSTKELSTCYDGQTELVRKNILDGKIGENVTGLFFPPPPLREVKPLTIKRDARRSFTATQKKQILAQQGFKCAKCHKKLGVAYHFHHAKPWSSGGKTIVKNGRALCGDCHEELSHKERLKNVDKRTPYLP